MGLTHEQAGVAWSHYRLCKARLEAKVALGGSALVARIGAAPAPSLPGLGARLYRLQRVGAVAVTAIEWRRVWSAYHARRASSA